MSILKKETDKLLDKMTPQEYAKYVLEQGFSLNIYGE